MSRSVVRRDAGSCGWLVRRIRMSGDWFQAQEPFWKHDKRPRYSNGSTWIRLTNCRYQHQQGINHILTCLVFFTPSFPWSTYFSSACRNVSMHWLGNVYIVNNCRVHLHPQYTMIQFKFCTYLFLLFVNFCHEMYTRRTPKKISSPITSICSTFRSLIRTIIRKWPTQCTTLLMYFNHTFLTNMFRSLVRSSSGRNYYKNTRLECG
jgi:hypothetical protein